MARQNIGTPRFYIDYLQYWKAVGIIKGIGNHTNNLVQGDSAQGEAGYPYILNGSSQNKTRYIGLDASISTKSPWEFVGADDEGYSDIGVILRQRQMLPTSSDFFIGVLNHNLSSVGAKGSAVMDFKRSYAGDTDFSSLDSLQAADVTLNEIVNYEDSAFLYNGFSLAKITGIDVETINTPADDDSLNNGFDIMDIRIGHTLAPNADISFNVLLGSLCFGVIFDMPNSPDIALSMKRQYDGIHRVQTIGGSTLTRVNYSHPSPWDSGPPFTLNTFDYTEEPDIDNSIEPSFNTKANISRGRRVWELSFSYISSDNLFAVNELMSKYNPTDSDSNGGYDAADHDADGHFEKNIMTDSSFFNTVLEKTMGGALPFIFQPDNSNNSPDQFAICVLDNQSISFEQVAFNTYNISLTIKEVW